MRKLLLASALLMGVAVAWPAAARAGFFFSFSEPGFGIAIGTPFHPPHYPYPPPVVYVPPPVVFGGYPVHHHHPRCGHGGYAWSRGYRGRGHRWR